MQRKYEVCSQCGRYGVLANKTKKLCQACNYKRLHSGKTRMEVLREKAKRTPKRNNSDSGEKRLFIEIWNERPHVCSHCGKKLPEQPLVTFFSHIKSKGAYPELRLCKSNIEIVCTECHYKYEFGKR